ncbi:adenylate/guanylate cyclase domain-containing protein [Candidatus Dojkabacteria bacterium]|nr:adenylate/guanylate cyclase domain-containing protein [Candidatus Dojkabacteria bacterium]
MDKLIVIIKNLFSSTARVLLAVFKYIIYLLLIGSVFIFLPVKSINKWTQDNVLPQDPLSENIVIINISVDENDLPEGVTEEQFLKSSMEKVISYDPEVVGINVQQLQSVAGNSEIINNLNHSEVPIVWGVPISEIEELNYQYSYAERSNIRYSYLHDMVKTESSLKYVHLFEYTNKSSCVNSFSLEIMNVMISDYNPELSFVCDLGGNLHYSHIPISINSSVQFSNVYGSPVIYNIDDIYSDNVSEDQIKGKVLIIGVIDDSVDSIDRQADVLSFVLNSIFKSGIANILTVVIAMFIGTVLLYFFEKALNYWQPAIFILIILFLGNIHVFFVFRNVAEWPFLQINLLLLLTYGFSLTGKFLFLTKENQFINKAFTSYMNPGLIEQLKQNPSDLKLGGESKEATILFADIRGFTHISERYKAEQLLNYLNEYFGVISNLILENDGTIDKYIGDCVMAFWNAPISDPDHASKALKAGVEMVNKIDELHTKKQFKDVNIGIGIHTGEVVIGNIGNLERFDYTAIGDNVNVASRIENLTKKYGVSLLISKETKDARDNGVDVIFRLVDEVIVKGRTAPLRIYEPLEKTVDNQKKVFIYEKAFDLYQKCRFEQAKGLLSELEDDNPAAVLIKRIDDGIDMPFNGVWKWDEK